MNTRIRTLVRPTGSRIDLRWRRGAVRCCARARDDDPAAAAGRPARGTEPAARGWGLPAPERVDEAGRDDEGRLPLPEPDRPVCSAMA